MMVISKRYLVLLLGFCCAIPCSVTAYYQHVGASFSRKTTKTRGHCYSPRQTNPFQTFRDWRHYGGTALEASSHDLIGEKESTGKEKETVISKKHTTGMSTERRTWDENYARLLNFFNEHGHADVPSHYKEDPKLGMWVTDQRRKRHSLSPDKIAKLDAFNMTWDGANKRKYDQQWENFFHCLEEYKEVEGDCCVPVEYPPNQKLARWVQRQRQSFKYGKLSPYRETKLNSIGFVWRVKVFHERKRDDLEALWEQRFEELLEYKKDNGHCRVPYKYKENSSLWTWVDTQRKFNVDGQLRRQDRKGRLDEIGFTWNFEEIFDEAWQNMYNQLVEIKNEQQIGREGNNLQRQTWASFKQVELLKWELKQQDRYKRGTLDTPRESKLAEIGYWESVGLVKA